MCEKHKYILLKTEYSESLKTNKLTWRCTVCGHIKIETVKTK